MRGRYFIFFVIFFTFANIFGTSYPSMIYKIGLSFMHKNFRLDSHHNTAIPPHDAKTNTMTIAYREANDHDLRQISQICVDAFEGPFPWHQLLYREFRICLNLSDLRDRYGRFVLKGKKHKMLVACSSMGEVVGFAEVGQLPCPIPVNATTTWQNQNVSIRPDVSFLGNVAVRSHYRRMGIARKLVIFACEVVERWQGSSRVGNGHVGSCDTSNSVESEKSSLDIANMESKNPFLGLYVAVDIHNIGANRLYESIGFEVVFDERNSSSKAQGRSYRPLRRYLRKALPMSHQEGEEVSTLLRLDGEDSSG